MERPPQTDTLPTRKSLVRRLRNLDDRSSWKEFFERYHQRVIRIAQSKGLTAVEAEDVAQEVFKRVARTINGFEVTARRGSFRCWLYQLTRWRTTDLLRERARSFRGQENDDSFRELTGSGQIPAIETVAGPCPTEDAFAAEASRHFVDTLIKRVEHAVTPKQLQIFQLLVLDEMEPAKVAELYRITLSSVYVTKHRVAEKLREEITRMQMPTT